METRPTFTGQSAAIGELSGRLTLVDGTSFCISARSGDIHPGHPHGLFHADTRFLSRLEMLVDGAYPEPLASVSDEHFGGQTVARAGVGADGEHALTLFRHRWVGRGLREDVVIRNFERRDAACTLQLRVGSDFADIFEVKEGRAGERPGVPVEGGGHEARLAGTGGLATTFRFDRPVRVRGGEVAVDVSVPGGGEWRLCMEVSLTDPDGDVVPRHRCGEPVAESAPAQEVERWRRGTTRLVTSEPRLARAYRASVHDLGSLRIPGYDGGHVVAAGAPWYMTLFGRDSLLASGMALVADPDLAVSTLQSLARLQGRRTDTASEEQPGRILHEVRTGAPAGNAPGSGEVYYGTADATPLFVMLVGELHRWGHRPDAVRRLLPHVDRAMEWIDAYGDTDGDGYVEYQRSSDTGLVSQGWKDSWDGVSSADGTIAETPIALCEVQAYVYRALRDRAELARAFEGGDAARPWDERADALRAAFDRDFWVDGHGWYAVGLDGGKRPIDALASNMGHALWAGIVPEHRAAQVAEGLLSPQMFSGWGVRTLASSMGRYHPLSYHNGSVWPHDTALAAAGLRRYGLVEQSHRLIDAVLAAAESYDGHLPELFGGISRADFGAPVDYTATSWPQAWAATVPMLFVRTLLGLEPAVPEGRVCVDVRLPGWVESIQAEGIRIGGGRVSIAADAGGRVEVDGLPAGVRAISPREG